MFLFQANFATSSALQHTTLVRGGEPTPFSKLKKGPPLFRLHPNGLFMFGLFMIGLQGYLDYRHLEYL